MLDLNTLREALDNVRGELTSARARQEELASYIESLQAEARGLELALARHNGQSDSDATATQEASRWRRMARTDAVLSVLEQSDKPLGAADITKVLHANGRDDARDHVAACLAYLKGKGRVEHLEDVGKYAVETNSDSQAPPLGFEGGDAL